jgi:hypothetical protein
MSRRPGVDITIRLTGPDKRGRIHISELGNHPEGWITLSPDPGHATYGGHAFEKFLELLNARRGG